MPDRLSDQTSQSTGIEDSSPQTLEAEWMQLSSTDPKRPPPPRTLDKLPEIAGYHILEELGRGGMGVVFLARQVGLNRLVALKMIQSGSLAKSEDLARFRIEAEAVAQLQHPNIVQIYEIGSLHEMPFFSLEYVGGGSLDQRLDGQPQSPQAAAALVEQLARAMHAAHERGIIHRDLKPANVLLMKNAECRMSNEHHASESLDIRHSSFGIPKITDFGLAKRLETDSGHTRTGEIIGTPSYMAPEQAAGKVRELGPGSDIYALGAMLYEMLTGRPPFKGLTPMETVLQVLTLEPVPPHRLRPTLPTDLETICLKCLSKEPQRRYLTAGELADDLGRFQRGEAIVARPLGRVERAVRWCRRYPAVAALLAAVFVSLAAGTVVSAFFAVQASRRAQDAEQAQERADRKAADALREKQRADANFERAKQAVREYLTAVAREPRLAEADFFALRKTLLTTALPLYQQLTAQAREDTALATERLDTLELLAAIQTMIGDASAAEAASRELKQFLQQRRAAAPGDADVQRRLMNTYREHGLCLLQLGRLAEAEQELNHGLALSEERLKQSQSPENRYALAQLQASLAQVWTEANRAADGERAARAAMQTLLELSKADPQNRRWAEELSRLQTDLGTLVIRQGRLADAEKEYQAARQFWAELAKQGGVQNSHSQLSSAILTYQLSRLFADQGRWQEAEREIRTLLPQLEQLIRNYPSVSKYRVLQGLVRSNYALTLQSTGRVQEAETQLLQAHDLLEPIAPPENPDIKPRRELARVNQFLGSLSASRRRVPEAEKYFRRSHEIYADLTRRFPHQAELQHELAATHLQRGNLFLESGQLDQAEADYRQCLALLEKLAAASPDNLHNAVPLGGCLCNLGFVELSRQNAAAALPWFDRAVATLDKVLQRESKSIQARLFLLNALHGRTGALHLTDRTLEALDALERAFALDDGRMQPVLQQDRQHLVGSILMQWEQLAATPLSPEMVTLLERLAKFVPLDGTHAWQAVRLCALSLPAAPDAAQAPLTRLAIAFLTRAHKAGQLQKPEHLDALRTAPDYAPLRARPEFQEWLQKMKLQAG